MAGATHLSRLDAVFYRMKFAHEAASVLEPAHSAEGRFHYGDQAALYLSQTPAGTIIASRRYMRDGDPERAIFGLRVVSEKIVDLRDSLATRAFQIDTTHRAATWQDWRINGDPAPTWTISDRVRALGLHGMLYASRSRPELTHLTLFDWNTPDGAQVTPDGPAQLWDASQPLNS